MPSYEKMQFVDALDQAEKELKAAEKQLADFKEKIEA